MPILFHHLREVKVRGLYIFVSLTLTMSVCLFFWQEVLFVLTYPLNTDRIIFTNLPEVFMVIVKMSILFACWFNLPHLIYNVWLFLAPALYEDEKRRFGWISVASLLVFQIAVLCAYYVVLPVFAHYFLGFQVDSSELHVEVEPRLAEYVNIVVSLFLFWLVLFQLPLFVVIAHSLLAFELLLFTKIRPVLYVVVFILSLFIAPPDVISQFLVVTPPVWLYEVYLLLLYFIANLG